MTALPVVVSYGGYNAAGRGSLDQSYRRMILDSLPPEDRRKTIAGLAALMGLEGDAQRVEQAVRDGTLIRRIEDSVFDPDNAPWNAKLETASNGSDLVFQVRKRQLP